MRPRRWRARAAAIIAACVAGSIAAQSIPAQTITGRVVLADSTTPARGVIVLAIDSAGRAAARALTGVSGRYVLRAPTTARYHLRVLRIGYRPSEGPTVDTGAGQTDVGTIVFAGREVVLSAVTVRDRQTCRVSADTGLAVAQVWDEARKAMVSTQLASGDAPLVAQWIEYDRMLDSGGRLVQSQSVRVQTHPTAHAFRSRPADELAKTGYVVAEGGATTYLAPDADVLLSDSFAATHCFRLAAGPNGQRQLIGIAFEPTRDRRDARDIAGTLWLDRATAELHTLDFRFTNLPDLATAAGAGGRVEFLRLDDGEWLVSRWHLRMPVVGPREVSSEGGARRVVVAASNLALRGVQVTGGEVTSVSRRDSIMYRATGPHIAVQVMARDTIVGAAGARLILEGTDYTADADSAGRIRLDPVLPGRYRTRLSTPLMDSLGLPPIIRELESRDDARADTIPLVPARDILRAVCPADSVRHGEGMLRGRVRDERARPIEAAAVTATWQDDFQFVDARDGQRLGLTERTIGALTDGVGQWRLCGVPRERVIAVHVSTDSGSDARRARLEPEQDFMAVDLVVHRNVPMAIRQGNAALGEPPAPSALVEVVVNELGAGPLADTKLEIVSRGRTRIVATGPSGRALIPQIAPGQLVVRAKHIGYAPGQFAVSVESGRNTVPIILSRNAPPTLDTVRVIGNQRVVGLRRNDEFETRRINHLATVSITRDDIVKRNPTSLWQMLTGVPSILVVDSNAVTVRSTRSDAITPDLKRIPCYLSIMVDGVIRNPDGAPFDLRMLPAPDEVHGVEVFAGASSIPLQYGGTGNGKWCGMIAIWTR